MENIIEILLSDTSKPIQVNIDQIINQIPEAVIITDINGTPVQWNQQAIDFLGSIPDRLTTSEWSGKLGLYTADGQSLYPVEYFPLWHALKGETVKGVEVFHTHGNHSGDRWLFITARPITQDNEEISGAILYIADIDEWKRIEIAHEQEKKLAQGAYVFQQQITEIGNDPLKILNKVASFAANNIGDGCIAALLNLSADRLKVITFEHHDPTAHELLYNAIISQEYILQDTIERVVRSGENILVPEMDQERIKKVVRPDQMDYFDQVGIQSLLVVPIKGRNRILGTLSLVRDRGGKPYTEKDQAYLLDIAFRTGLAVDNNYLINLVQVESSERHHAQAALEQSEIRFQSIFTSTTLGIKLLDLEGKVMETNPAFEQMLGYSHNELLGKPISTFWHPSDKKYLDQIITKAKNSQIHSEKLEHRLIAKDGSVVWVSVTFTRINTSEQNKSAGFIVAIAENITQHKEIDAEISRMKSKLQGHVELERLRLAQELHDGPVQEIYSSVFKLENWLKSANPPDQEKVIALKQDLINVVQELRATAKDLRPPALADFGLERAMRSYTEEFTENHPELTIRLNLAHDAQMLPEDIRLILFRIYQHSLMNILRHAQATDVYVRFIFDAEEAQLEIADNGVGFVVPANWVDLVRQGHYGLAGAVERVSLLDGSFAVDSTPGQGTVVRVVLPIPYNVEMDENEDAED